MPRRPAITPSEKLTLMLPQDVRVRLDLFLHSDLQGRVPVGAYQRFFTARILEFFGDKPLDLAPFLGSPPGEFVVRAPIDTIARLQDYLLRSRVEAGE